MNKKEKCVICGEERALAEIKGNKNEIVLCANHLIANLSDALELEPMTGMCECCNEDEVFRINTGPHCFTLCRKHLIDLVFNCLDAESYRKLTESVNRQGGEFEYYLHDDFYSEDGYPYSPQYEAARAHYRDWNIDVSMSLMDSLIEQVHILTAECGEYCDIYNVRMMKEAEEKLLCMKKKRRKQ